MTDTFICIASRAAHYPVIVRRSQMSKTAMFSSNMCRKAAECPAPSPLRKAPIAAIISA
ncbi:hypothetical protein [Methanovulcanius yangii]|uniref:hypothetical protein n=1 Tax=Methanovulcanius yangii TaxID=1789227 RepID=UPI0029CA6FD0|nr:hypothetical protein [Methanovulcanius yangii]